MRPLLLALFVAGCSGTPLPVDGGAGGGSPTGGGTTSGGGTATGGGAATGGGGGAGGGDGGGDGGALLPGEYARTLTGFTNRGYDLIVPSNTDGGVLPAIVMLHGGGGTRSTARRSACPGGVMTSADCLDRLASARGFVVVIPDGTGAVLRTWNAGGGSNGWQCISGGACTSNVDEHAFFTALFADVARLVELDTTRLYATGLSNGAAMSHRLACEFPEVAGIASVAGGNQYSTTQACTRSASVLEIHGTADPCWNFDGGPASCADTNPGSKISVPDSLSRWAANNGCDGGEATEMLPDSTSDGTLTMKHVYSCGSAALEFYEVLDGGHTWPGGFSVGSNAGTIATDWTANLVILDFFSAH